MFCAGAGELSLSSSSSKRFFLNPKSEPEMPEICRQESELQFRGTAT